MRSDAVRSAVSGAIVAAIVTRSPGRVALVFGAVLAADWLVTQWQLKQA